MQRHPLARILHWSIAGLVLGALASGYAITREEGFSLALLRVHLALGAAAGGLTLIRVMLWMTKGAPESVFVLTSRIEVAASRIVHITLRLMPLLLLASGIGMLVVSGKAEALLDGTLSGLSAFETLPPRKLHHAAAFLLAALTLLHALAAIKHRLQAPRRLGKA